MPSSSITTSSTSSTSSSGGESVRVVVRCRPLSEKEASRGEAGVRCVEVHPSLGRIDLRGPSSLPTDPPKSFTFDAVYDCGAKNAELYEETFSPLVASVLDGFNGTIFAYGQTGTGKTWTMEGSDSEPGVIPNAFAHIFSRISASDTDFSFLVRASYLEIYQEDIIDLLAAPRTSASPPGGLELKERPDTGVYVKDLSSFVCKSQAEIEHVMKAGKTNRTVGATNMNEYSSRSHAIFVVTVECSSSADGHIRVGKLNMVDLAGSERQSKTGASGNRLKEATKINLSLSALGNVISALVDGKSSYIPYRDSKLTRLLQDSLGGNAKTVMVANIGPAVFNYDETLTTLRYANRAKNIKNKPTVNEDPKDALLREFQEEIARLKSQLNVRQRKKRKTEDNNDGGDDDNNDNDGIAKLAIERELLEGDTTMLAEEKEKLLRELKAKEAALEKERLERERIEAKVKAMESKLISGDGSNMVERTNEQQRALEKQKADLNERKRLARLAAQELEAKEEQGMELERTYSSLQNEVEAKTRKLKKLFLKLQTVKQDIIDVTEEYNRDRRDLETTQQELLKELKLKHLMIENFIPNSEKRKILSRSHYDEEEDNWVLLSSSQSSLQQQQKTVTKRPISSSGSRRPVSEYARKCLSNNSNLWRYRGENIMRLSLDAPGRTTRDYEGPAVAPRVQAALDAAMLNVEPDIELDVGSLNSSSFKGMIMNKRRQQQPQTTEQQQQQPQRKQYPSSRGLVPK